MAEAKEIEAHPSPDVNGAEKGGVLQIEDNGHLSKKEKIHQIDAIAEHPNVTLETFAHLDINKILRKVDLHLIPMLTALVSAILFSRSPTKQHQ